MSTVTGNMLRLTMLNKDAAKQSYDLRQFFQDNRVTVELSKHILHFAVHHPQLLKKKVLEADLPVLTNMPEDLKMALHVEIYHPLIIMHPFFEALAEHHMTSFCNLCHEGMSQASAIPREEVFDLGAAATSMYFIAQGELSYSSCCNVFAVGADEWLVEAALWVPSWRFRGRLMASTKCEMVLLGVEEFHAYVSSVDRSTPRGIFVNTYASQFVRNGAVSDDVNVHWSDIWCSRVQLEWFVNQAELYLNKIQYQRYASCSW